MKIREPVVAGSFYPAGPEKLRSMIDGLLESEMDAIELDLAENITVLGGIVPHAGYPYSGYEAVHFFKILAESRNRFDTVIIMNPNHYGKGPGIATDDAEYWKTPLGKIRLDTEMIDLLGLQRSSEVYPNEHSAEVLLPFLQRFLKDEFSIVPVSFLNQEPERAYEFGERLYNMAGEGKRKILVIASSDFSHYIEPERGEAQDKKIIEHILALDPDGAYREKRASGASVCGIGPILALMWYCILHGNKDRVEGKLLKFGNSGKSGPADLVVDYASILFYGKNPELR